MNRFNLTFSGEIVTGQKPDKVKLRFAKMFAIDDPVRLERFFSGETVTLRRNLERKEAAQCFQDLRKIGAVSELVKVTASEAANALVAWPTTPKDENAGDNGKTVVEAESGQDDDTQDQTGHEKRREPQQNNSTEPGGRERLTAKKAARLQAELEGLKQAKAEEEAQLKAELQQLQRRKEEEVASLQAEGEARAEEERIEAEKAAQLKAEKEEQRRLKKEEAARLKAEREEQKRLKAEETARRKAQREEQKRLKAEEAARVKAEKEEQQRAAQEAARIKAEEEERERQAAEEAARIKAEKEERERQAAEQATRIKAEEEERERQAAEEAARIKAEKEERERQAAEEAARIKAEKEERERQAAEEAARIKAEKEERERQAAEEAARIKAEEEERARQAAEKAARIKAEKEERERQAAEEAARIKAEEEERARRAAEEAARIKAEEEERARQAAEEAARLQAELDEIQRQEEELSAELQAELAEKERQVAIESVRIKADAEHRRAEAKRKSLERRRTPGAAPPTQPHLREPALQDTATDRVADINKAVHEVAGQKAAKPVKARVKTNIDVPQRLSGEAAAITGRRKRQPGEPNLYQLQAFRNTPEVRNRATRATQQKSRGFTLGGLALAALLILTGIFLRHPPAPALVGPSAIGVDLQQGLVILAGDSLLFHDRAGIGTRQVALGELGADHLQSPMAFDNAGNLIAVGKLIATTDNPAPDAAPVLLRCELALSRCLPFSAALANSRVGAFAINPIDNSLLLADTAAGQLLKIDAQGKILQRKDIEVPTRPVMRMNSGLLFMNSAAGPAISVFRYDDSAFGQQLDEVLLLPPAAATLEQTSTGNFTWSAGAWWVNLINPGNGSTGLYRFDMDWNFLTQVELPFDTGRLELDSWAMKTLVNDGRSVAIQRFNAEGIAEVPLVSSLLEKRVDLQQRRDRISALSWLGALLISAAITVLGLCYGYLQHLRTLVYKPQRERGAQPVDDYEDTLQWIDPVKDRIKLLRRRGISYAVLATALSLLAIGSSVSAWQLTALLIALSGPAIALLLWSRRPPGNIAHLDQHLLLVDHRGMYHMGEGPQVNYRGSFLMIDDVLVFTGNRLLPAFFARADRTGCKTIAAGGVKVDRNTVMVRLCRAATRWRWAHWQ